MTFPGHSISQLVSGPPVLFEPIADRNVTSGAEVDLTWTGDFAAVFIDIFNVRPATDSVQLRCRTSSDGGATFDSGATDYDFRFNSWLASQTNIGGPGAYLPMSSVGGIGNALDENCQMSLILLQPFDTAGRTQIIGHGGHQGSTGNPASHQLYGRRDAAVRVDGVRFYWESGDFAEGRFTASGLRRD